jgi:hypothetical protein
MIESAAYADAYESSITVTIDGIAMSVPANPLNRHWRELADWVAQGGVIEPYIAPPESPPPRDLSAELDALAAALVKKGALTREEIEGGKSAGL